MPVFRASSKIHILPKFPAISSGERGKITSNMALHIAVLRDDGLSPNSRPNTRSALATSQIGPTKLAPKRLPKRARHCRELKTCICIPRAPHWCLVFWGPFWPPTQPPDPKCRGEPGLPTASSTRIAPSCGIWGVSGPISKQLRPPKKCKVSRAVGTLRILWKRAFRPPSLPPSRV